MSSMDNALRKHKEDRMTEGVFVTGVKGEPMFLRGGSIDALYIEPPYDASDDPQFTVIIGGSHLLVSEESYEWLVRHLENFSFLMQEDGDGQTPDTDT